MRVIICGAGRVGAHIAHYLSETTNHVTVIDTSPHLINQINERLEVRALCGFASHPDVLEQAGAAQADMLIAVTASDEVNMMACEVAMRLFNVPFKIARIRSQAYLDSPWQSLYGSQGLGVDLVISPELEVAQAISRSLKINGAFDMILVAEGRLKIIGLRCTAESPMINTPLFQLTSLFPHINATVIALIRQDQNIIPTLQETLIPGDAFYVAVPQSQVAETLQAFGQENTMMRRLLILGGGNIGFSLAQEMEQNHQNVHLEIIEKDPQRAAFIARVLKKTTVLCGDALDVDILHEAHVNLVETVVAVTEDERVNTLASLLAKRLGAGRTLSLLNNTLHTSLVTSLGVDAVINPRQVTVSKILQNIRRDSLQSLHSLGEKFGEVLEGEVQETSRLAGMMVENLGSVGEVIVAALIRQEDVIIPHSQTVLKIGDRVIMMVKHTVIQRIEKLFGARQTYYE